MCPPLSFASCKQKCPHSFQGMPIAPNKHKKCTCMPANNPYLQLNCFQGFFTVSKEKKTLPKCMVTVLWFSVALPLAWGSKALWVPTPPRFTILGAGILTCTPFDRRRYFFVNVTPQTKKKKFLLAVAHTKNKKKKKFQHIFFFENGFPLSLRTG